MQEPFLTIAIPTLNREQALLDTIACIYRSVFTDFEIIIVDQTLKHSAYVEKELEKLKRTLNFHYIHITKKSLPSARNVAIKKAKGKIILFLDDDVLFNEDFLGMHCEAYMYDKKVVAVGGRVITQGKENEIDTNEKKIHFGFNAWIMPKFTGTHIFYPDTVRGCNMSFKTVIFTKIGLFDEAFVKNAIREESDVCLRIKKAGFNILFYPKAELTHLDAKQGGCKDEEKQVARYSDISNYQNEFYFFFKHFSLFQLPFFIGAMYAYYLAADVVKGRISLIEFAKRHVILYNGLLRGRSLSKAKKLS